jgi:hypothetical protein
MLRLANACLWEIGGGVKFNYAAMRMGFSNTLSTVTVPDDFFREFNELIKDDIVRLS